MKASGQTEEQIEFLVPRKASERRQKALEDAKDLIRMKQDLLSLQQEVKRLRNILVDNKLRGVVAEGNGAEESTKQL